MLVEYFTLVVISPTPQMEHSKHHNFSLHFLLSCSVIKEFSVHWLSLNQFKQETRQLMSLSFEFEGFHGHNE